MAYFRCGHSGQSGENDLIPIIKDNNIEFISINNFLPPITNLGVCYKAIELSSIPLSSWNYTTSLNVPCFQFPIPSVVKSNSAGFLLDGYTSVRAFWDNPINIKCVASGGYYINISNNDFNNINDFVNSIQDKVLYMPLTKTEVYLYHS